jgi:cytidine deaminase
MKNLNISVPYSEYNTIEELDHDDSELAIAAREAALNAYAPYSGFRVGAAVRLSNGIIVKGANVENAAYPSGICAERNALAHCVTNHPDHMPVAIAISAFNDEGITDDNISPCGMCRQVIAEEESRNGNKIKMILAGSKRILILDSISHLLPLHFNKDNLRIVRP